MERPNLTFDVDELLSGFASGERIQSRLMALETKLTDDTYNHSLRVAAISSQLGERFGIIQEYSKQLCLAALTHDIGKLYPLVRWLAKKPGLLDKIERLTMRIHVRKSINYLKEDLKPEDQQDPMIHRILAVVGSHHEFGIDEESIYPRRSSIERGVNRRAPFDPLTERMKRVLAVSDTYDALVSLRPYKNPMPPEEALAQLSHQFTGGLEYVKELASILPSRL